MKTSTTLTRQQLETKWGNIVAASGYIFSWTERCNLAYLAEMASGGKTVVECGTYMGRSAKVMLGAGCGKIYCVDTFGVVGTYECCRYFMREEIEKGRCELLKMQSDEAGALLADLGVQPDFIFVDDGHAYEDAIRDIKALFPILKIGGTICGHDYDAGSAVAKAVDELLPGRHLPVWRIWALVKEAEAPWE